MRVRGRQTMFIPCLEQRILRHLSELVEESGVYTYTYLYTRTNEAARATPAATLAPFVARVVFIYLRVRFLNIIIFIFIFIYIYDVYTYIDIDTRLFAVFTVISMAI